jgi:hypothetical protein
MFRKFKSSAHEEKYAYTYDSGSYDAHAPVDPHFRMFETCGDGLTQHSPDWSVQIEFLADYLASLAQAMIEDAELAQNLLFTFWRRPSVEQITFAASIRYKAPAEKDWFKGRRWFSVKELKLSKSQSKEHDRRYEEVREIHDGSPSAIYRMVLPEYASGLEKYLYADAVREWVLAQKDGGMYMPVAAEFLKWTDDRDKARQVRDGFEACKNICESYRLRATAESYVENYRRMTAPKPEPKPEPAPEPKAAPESTAPDAGTEAA